MKVLYSRMAQGRKKKYQVITRIVLADGKKYVLKKAVCVEAEKHVENTFHNESIMAPVYCDCLLRSQWTKDGILTPYIEGETLGSRLRKYLLEQEEGKARNLLKQWRECITGNSDNICRFVPSKEFETVFGKADDLEGSEATKISNFDCSAENVFFLKDGGIKMIDYEWVFPFCIPIELTFYKVLKMFFECNQGLTDWTKLLEMSGIEEYYSERYERLIDAFSEYTFVDKERDINYALMGKKFKVGKILERNREVFQYRFPYDLIPEGKTIVLYGAGHVGEDFYRLIKMTDYCRLVMWTDKNAQLYRKQGLQVADIEEIGHCIYDYILIAVYQQKVAREIRTELELYGIDPNKIVWKMPILL